MSQAVSRNAINQSLLGLEDKKVLAALIATDTVAATGSTQAGAALVSASRNAVTLADDAVGVRLPTAEVDAEIVVLNTVSNKILLVYPNLGEQINAIAANSAYSVPAGIEASFRCDVSGHWYVSAGQSFSGVTASATEINKLTAVVAGTTTASKALVVGASKNLDTLAVALFSFGAAGIETALTAGAGGTQASGSFALSATKSVHRFTIVASAADSAILPAATGSGVVHVVINDDLSGATSMQLYAAALETIDDITSATGVAIAATKRRILIDTGTAKWTSVLGA